MKGITSFFMSIVTFFASLFGCGGGQIIDQKKAENFKPVIRFTVCSDTHIGSSDDIKCQRVANSIKYAYEFAESDKNYSKLDAVMFVGDVTDNGRADQFKAFEDVTDASIKGDTKLLAIVAKNHDGWGELGKDALNYISAITNEGSDFHVVINGFHFIGISTSNKSGQRYGAYQKTWVKKQLAEAAKDDPNKPIFVFTHEHMKNTVYGSSSFDGWGVNDFKATLKKYPQVVHFSGHSHYPLNDPRSISQDKFTAIGTGAMSYMELTVDSDRTVHPEHNDDSGQTWLVEIDADNQIRLRGYDINDGTVLCDYLITNPADRTTFAYTEENQIAHSSAPVFEKGAGLSVSKNDDGKYVVTAPSAKSTDEKIVFLYRIYVKNASGKTTHTEYLVNDYWLSKPYDEVKFTVDASSGYTIEVVAENAYGMQSEALSYTI